MTFPPEPPARRPEQPSNEPPGQWQPQQQPAPQQPGQWQPPQQPGQWQAPQQQPVPQQPGQWQPPQQQPSEDPGFEVLPHQPKRGRGKLLASVGAVIVLAAGGAISYVAFASGSSGGSSSPTAAVQGAIDDLHNRDLIGLINDLPPGERNSLSGPFNSDIASLKRLGVLSSDADPHAVTGWKFTAKNLTYGKTIQVNDHVQIVQITGGSVVTSGNAAQLPFSQRFRKLTKAPDRTDSQHHAITHPVRIAVEKVDGGWYPSIFYTAADGMAHHQIPTAADSVPAVGESSPDAAVESMITALTHGDFTKAIELVSPDEMGALHDYGGMLTKTTPSVSSPITLNKIQFKDTSITGGVRVAPSSITMTASGQQIHVTISGSCVTVDAGGINKKFCASDAADTIGGYIGAFACSAHVQPYQSQGGGTSPGSCSGPKFTPAQKRAITDLVTGLLSAGGIDTAQTGGKWYITPVRSFADVGASILQAMKGDDLYQLAGLANTAGEVVGGSTGIGVVPAPRHH